MVCPTPECKTVIRETLGLHKFGEPNVWTDDQGAFVRCPKCRLRIAWRLADAYRDAYNAVFPDDPMPPELDSVAAQGQLTPELQKAILAADTKSRQHQPAVRQHNQLRTGVLRAGAGGSYERGKRASFTTSGYLNQLAIDGQHGQRRGQIRFGSRPFLRNGGSLPEPGKASGAAVLAPPRRIWPRGQYLKDE